MTYIHNSILEILGAKKASLFHLALLAAIVSTLCDKVHVLTGTLYYPNPVFDGQPWWNLPGFFLAFLTMGMSYLQLIKYLPSNISRSSSANAGEFRSFLESMLIFVFVYLLSGFGNESPLILNLLFYSTFLLRLAFTPDKIFMLILSIILGIAGSLAEGILSALDLVYYTKPVIFHVPLWLAALYFHGAFALKDGMRFFVFRKA